MIKYSQYKKTLNLASNYISFQYSPRQLMLANAKLPSDDILGYGVSKH